MTRRTEDHRAAVHPARMITSIIIGAFSVFALLYSFSEAATGHTGAPYDRSPGT